MGRSAALVRLLQRAKSVAPEAVEEFEGGADARDALAGEGGDGDAANNTAMLGAHGPAPARDAGGDAAIASIFATIRDGGSELTQDELPEDTGATYALLSRLDQLWQHSEA